MWFESTLMCFREYVSAAFRMILPNPLFLRINPTVSRKVNSMKYWFIWFWNVNYLVNLNKALWKSNIIEVMLSLLRLLFSCLGDSVENPLRYTSRWCIFIRHDRGVTLRMAVLICQSISCRLGADIDRLLDDGPLVIPWHFASFSEVPWYDMLRWRTLSKMISKVSPFWQRFSRWHIARWP